MRRLLGRLGAALDRLDIGLLAFVAAMAMLGMAAALLVTRGGSKAPGSKTSTAPQHHVLVSPYQSRPFSRGQLMVSSSRARGRSTPRDVAELYQRLGYAWLSITDVNTVDPADEYAVNGIVTMYGEEMQYKFGHFLVYGVDHDALADTPADVSTWVHRAAGLLFLSRPLEEPTFDATAIGSMPGLDGIQLYDARLAREQPPLADASDLWDKLLTAGHHLTAIAGDDAISIVGPGATAGATSVDVQVTAVSPPLIADALKRGAFVDSTGVRVLGVQALGDTITVVTTDADQITFIGAGGRVLGRTSGARGDYKVKWDEQYVRAVASRRDGAKAWTMPVWLVP